MSVVTFVENTAGQPIIPKDPEASLVYGIDVAGLLGAGDSISSVSTAASSGITAGTAVSTGTIVKVRISGGTVGTTGSVTLRWTTANGDTDERTLYFDIKQR